MPNYKVNDRYFDISDDKVDLFEADFPDAQLSYQLNDGRTFNISASQRKDFLLDFPDAKEIGWGKKQEDPLKAKPMWGSSSYEENVAKTSDGLYYPSPLNEEGRAGYDPISTEERSRQEYEMLTQKLGRFNSTYGEFMDRYEAFENVAKKQTNEGGFAMDTEERRYINANSEDYRLRKQERDEINDRIARNSYFNQLRMSEADAASEAADGIAQLVAQERANNRKLDLEYNLWNMQHMTPYTSGPSIKRALSPEALEYGNAQADLQAAERLYRKTSEIYAAPVNDGKQVLKAFGKGVADRGDDLDFWTMGLSAIADDLNTRQAFKKIQDKFGSVKQLEFMTDKELDELLTPSEQILISAYLDNLQAQAARINNTSGGYKAGQGAADSAMFMAQFLLTGGIGEAATTGTQVHKNVVNWLGRKIGSMNNGIVKSVARGTAKLGVGTAESIGKALVMTPLMPHTYANIADKMMSFDDKGELMDVTDALLLGASDALIETWSESTGDFVNKVLGVPGKLAKGMTKKYIKNVPFDAWGHAMNAPMMKLLRKGGFNGFLGEMGEEFIGNAVRSFTIDPEAFKEFAKMENLLVTAGSFAPMTIFGLGTSSAQYGWQKRKLAKAQAAFEGILRNASYTDYQIKFAVDELLGSTDAHLTPERLVQNFTPLLQELAYNDRFSGNRTQALEAAVKFMWEIARYRAYDGVYHKLEQDQVRDMQAEILEGTGKEFWTTRLSSQAGSDGTSYETDEVRAVEFSDGRVAYVLGNDGTGNIVVYSDGKPGFFTEDQLNEGKANGTIVSDATMRLNDYLTQQVARVRLNAEEMRMFEERNDWTALVRAKFPVGSTVELGTTEAPIEGIVRQLTADGAIVESTAGVSQLTWEELGHTIGIEVKPQTDAQIEEETINNLEIADLQRRREREKRRAQSSPEVEQRLAETQAVDQAANEGLEKPIPTKADGSVDQTTLWNESPARWAQWKTEQRQDGGAYASSYIQNAIGILEGQIATNEEAFLAEADFDAKDALEQTIAQQKQRLAELYDLSNQYAPAQIPAQEEAQAEEAKPVVMAERQKFDLDSEYQRRLSLAKALAEKEMILKEYFDAISQGSMEAVVMNKQNYKKIMKDLGCSEEMIQEVTDAIKNAEEARQAVNALHANGKVFIIAEYNSSVENGRLSYVHERQHNITQRRQEYVQKILALGLGREELQKILMRLAHTDFYNDKSDEILADEIISSAMELGYTYDDFSVILSKFGVPTELIVILSEINDEQRNDYTLVNARRNQATDHYAGRSGGEDEGDQEQVSSGVLGSEGEGSLEDSQRGASTDEPGEGTTGEEVVEEPEEPQGPNFRVTKPEDNLSDETKKELADKGLVMEGGAIMSDDYAELKQALAYQTPIERNPDLDGLRFSYGTRKAHIANYKKHPEAEKRVVALLERFAERIAMSELVSGVVSTTTKHNYGAKEKGSYAGPLRTNEEYVITFDLDTTCPRTFQYLNLVGKIEKRIGRPLTQTECIQLIEMMRMYGQQIPCVYCYAENKRQALKDLYTRFMESRHAVISAKIDEEALPHMYGHNTGEAGNSNDPAVALAPAAYKVFQQWRSNPKGTYNPTIKMLWARYNNDRNSVLTLLDELYASKKIDTDMTDERLATIVAKELGVTSKKASKVIEEIAGEWKWDAIEGKDHVDFTPVEEDDLGVNEKAFEVWRDMTSYAKSASSAKSVVRFTPYTDELKKVSQEDRDYINGMGGVRMHSTNDFRIDYVFDYFQFMADMALYKMFGHTYTKSPEFVRIFGNSGYKINMSIAAYQDENGKIRPNADEGFDWEEAKRLRALFPNAGIMLMATSDEQIQMALDSDWIDMVIPFHDSGLPRAVWYNMRLWQNYQSVQKEKFLNSTEKKIELKAAGVMVPKGANAEEIDELFNQTFDIPVLYNKKGKRLAPHFLPGPTTEDGNKIPGHNNDHQEYLRLCKKYGVKPRFAGMQVRDNSPEGGGRVIDITEHPRYMILVKETARTDTPQTPVQFNFDEPSEALDGKSPLEYAFYELEARAMTESELEGTQVDDIYKSLKKDQFGIADQFINTFIKHKNETGEEYPLDYLTPESRDWFLVQRKALEEAFKDVETIPYHRNEYDEQGNLVENVRARVTPQEETTGPIDLIEEAKKAVAKADAKKKNKKTKKSEVRMRITPEMDKAYMDAVNAGDMETAQRMVIEAAKLAMPNTKVVDEDGNPKVVYHGGSSAFTKFDTSLGDGMTDLGQGSYFSSIEEIAREYTVPNGDNQWQIDNYIEEHPYLREMSRTQLGLAEAERIAIGEVFKNAKVYPVFLNMENPYYTTMEDFASGEFAHLYNRDGLRGYDGIIDDTFKDRFEDFAKGAVQYVAFEPSQIKSADPVTYDDNGNAIPLSQRFKPENEDIRFSVRTDEQREKLFEDAKEQYGVTDNFNIAGYMLPDGSLLNFADKEGEPNIRGIDHRNIGSIINDREYESRWDYITDFLNEGAIRLMPESDAIHLSVAPSEQQREKLLDYFYKKNGYIILELADQNGNSVAYMEYDRRTSPARIFRDIDGYFNEGIVPEQTSDLRFSIIGERGAMNDKTQEGLARLANLDVARQMESELNPDWSAKEDENALKIKVATGWERGADGKWRYEVDDIHIKPAKEWLLSKKKLTLKDIVEPNPVFDMYPELLEIAIVKDKSKYNLGAWYDESTKQMKLPVGALKDEYTAMMDYYGEEQPYGNFARYWRVMEEDFLHEIQHAIQHREGFARGGSPEMLLPEDYEAYKKLYDEMSGLIDTYNSIPYRERNMAYAVSTRSLAQRAKDAVSTFVRRHKLGEERYRRLAGEVESSNVVNRSKLSDHERYNSLLASTEDVARKDQIFLMNSVQTTESSVRFRMSNNNQAIFVSNAAKAVEEIKQEKATPEQWLKMIEKNGGLKAGEDKWMGLSDWLKASDKKTLTKGEVLEFINEHKIIIEEQHYADSQWKESERVLNKKYPGWDEAFSFDMDEYSGRAEAFIEDNQRAMELYNANHKTQVSLDEWDEFSEKDENRVERFGVKLANIRYGKSTKVREIHGERARHITHGLANLHEIALTVPNIEPWEEEDTLHFGDAGGGRAIAWIRFGDTYGSYTGAEVNRYLREKYGAIDYEQGNFSEEDWDKLMQARKQGKKVLVIDEIQSNRHQEGRKRGYKDIRDIRAIKQRKAEIEVEIEALAKAVLEGDRKAKRQQDALFREHRELSIQHERGEIPDAPFEKNWADLAMKRMLRYAAENGYDAIAWTKGDQQAYRYNLSRDVKRISASKQSKDGERIVNIYYRDEYDDYKNLVVDKEGKVIYGDYFGSYLADVVGKEMALQIMNAEAATEFKGEGLKIGGEGMRGFYDKMLPAFMNKYGKKWGVRVEDIELPNLEEAGQTMHSIPVTEEMKASVMEGQVMFRATNKNQAIFVSNAAKAVEAIKQEKATPQQWLKMLEKNGGLKAGEDKWMGLSDWLKASDKKTLTKAEVLDFIKENMIIIEETHYEYFSQDEIDEASEVNMRAKYGEEFMKKFFGDAFIVEDDMYRGWRLAIFNEETAVQLYNEANGTSMAEPGEYGLETEDYDIIVKWGTKIVRDAETIDGVRPINETRQTYQSKGLTGRHEIALTVPTIESWNEDDAVHFGEAGEGRAVAWIRFGETIAEVRTEAEMEAWKELDEFIKELYAKYGDSDAWTLEESKKYSDILDKTKAAKERKKVLVIDEIQSKRHQDAREMGGYRVPNVDKWLADHGIEVKETGEFYEFYHSDGEMDKRFSKGLLHYNIEEAKKLYVSGYNRSSVPDAPFEKNWHELAMKRMLRYAAENGYDAVAWTKGDQQNKRYNLSKVVDHIQLGMDFTKQRESSFRMFLKNGKDHHVGVDRETGLVTFYNENKKAIGKPLSELLGKELAEKVLGGRDYQILTEVDFELSEGMKGFYDKILPAFMNKYGKQWGVKVSNMYLNRVEEGIVMHSIPVTEEMKASVMEGQVMFRMRGENESAEEFAQSMIKDFKEKYDTKAIITTLDPTSKEQLAKFAGVPVKSISDEMLEQLLRDIEKEDKRAWINEDTHEIAIFVRESVVDGKMSELVLIHENIHDIIARNSDLLALGEYLWKNVEKGSKEYRYRREIPKRYSQDRWYTEMAAYVISEHMQDGTIRDLVRLLDLEHENMLNKLLNISGYGKERKERKAGSLWNVLRKRHSSKSSETSEREPGKPGNNRFRVTEIAPEVRAEMDVISATAIINGNYLKAPNGKDTKLTPEQWAMVRTKNFKSWFGDWENDPENASKVVDPETGEPMVVYHGTGREFYKFEHQDYAYENASGKGFYFTDDPKAARLYTMSGFLDNQDKMQETLYGILYSEYKIDSDEAWDLASDYMETGEADFEQIEEAYNKAIAEMFPNPTIMPVFLNLRRPYDIVKEGAERDSWIINKEIQKNNLDGVIDEGFSEAYKTLFSNLSPEYQVAEKFAQYMVVDASQIKSATDNTGEFSPTDPDIRFRVTPEMDEEYLTAVMNGDMETAQKMVDEVAEAWARDSKVRGGTYYNEQGSGPLRKMYHGTGDYGFYVFNTKPRNNNIGSHFGTEVAGMEFASRDGDKPGIYKVYLNIKNPFYTFDWFAQDDGYPVVVIDEIIDNMTDADARSKALELFEEMRKFPGMEWVTGDQDADLDEATNDHYLTNVSDHEAFYVLVREIIELAGYDGLSYDNDLEDRGERGPQIDYIALYPNQIKSAEPVTYDDEGYVIPLSQRFNSEKSDLRFRTSMELDEEFGDAWRNQQNEDGRHSTQVANTKSTYEKIGRWMRDAGLEGVSVLDASSGLGLGTQALREMGFKVDDVEPFPSENREAPTFASYDDIDGKYDVVISNAVLNVIPDDWRADVLRKMASVVKDGGKMIINTRPASNISKQGVEGKTRITLDSPSEILVKRGDRIAAYQKGFTSEELAEWIMSELGEGWRVEKATKANSGISGEGTAVVIKEGEPSFRVTGTPTDEVVANGLNLSPAQTADLAGKIFASLPEDARKKITEGLRGNILGLQDAIMQIPVDLAMKENWDDQDRAVADTVAEEMTKMAGEMTRPFSAPEALWILFNDLNKSTDLISEAQRSLVRRNLGFDSQTQEQINKAKDGVRFRAVGNASANATASLYNKGAVNVWTRLKETFVDMHASVEELVKSIEKRTKKRAEGFENILMALNQQSSKGLAMMESYERDYLKPMFDEIISIMKKTGLKYKDVVRYVILKHGLERNDKLAQRDARTHYQEIYDEIIAKIKSMDAAQKRTYLTNAQLRSSDAKAKLAQLQGVNTTGMTADQLDAHKKDLAKAKADVTKTDAELSKAQKIATMTEADAQDELDKIFDRIEKGKDSVYKELRKNDYSGISSMFYDQLGVNRKDYETEEEYQAALMDAKIDRFKTLEDVEIEAETEVAFYEKAFNPTELWKRINAATKKTLRQQYEANMISQDQYKNLRDMFEYYVPLRGFADNTAEDMYTYFRKPNSTGYVKPILGAEGRKTEAESPFGWIASMAGSAIASNVKNEAKLALYYFVANRPDNGVATLSKTWFVLSGVDPNTGKKVFVPAYPPFTEDLSTASGKAQYETWLAGMEQLRSEGKAYEAGQRLNLGNSVVNISDANKPEHIVNVKVAGKEYTIVINGNPRAAQAINGDLNIETVGDYSTVFGPILRWMSSVNTSYNPEFWITNMQRDMLFTFMAVNAKEDPAYRRKFRKNYAKAFKVVSMNAKNEKGTIGNDYLERMYKDFVANGGVTGYTQIKDSEVWEKEIEKYIKSNNPTDVLEGNMMKKIKGGLHAFHRFGESLEQVSRFAAFLTSREMGKSMTEAINDAKEITVNFNRKGSGKRITFEETKYLTKKRGQRLNGVERLLVAGLSSIAPLGRRTIMFFNAAIQGLNAMYKLCKNNPSKMAGWSLGYLALGAMQALVHGLLDDDDDYLDIPEYERRNSLLLGANGYYFKWALPQEARAFYAMGDLVVTALKGRYPQGALDEGGVLRQTFNIVGEVLPINPSEGWRAFVPSVLLPFVEIAINEDYKGSPIYNEQKWLSDDERARVAKWETAYQGTGKIYVNISKVLNNLTDNSDLDEAGLINIHPEMMQHIVQSAFGGTIRTMDKFFNTISAALDPDEPVTVRQTPFLNRLLTVNDERYKNVHVNQVFDYYEAEAKYAQKLLRQYQKEKDSAGEARVKETEEFKWYEIYMKHRSALVQIEEKIRSAEGSAERKDLMQQQDEIKRQVIKEISEL